MLGNIERLIITNAFHCTFSKENEPKMIEALVQIYSLAKDCYYAGYPFLDDYAFDQLEDLLKARDPDNKILQRVGVISSMPLPSGMPLP